MALIIAATLLIVFVANVTLGSMSGEPPLGSVAELLLLIGAAVAFTVAILRREAHARDEADGRRVPDRAE